MPDMPSERLDAGTAGFYDGYAAQLAPGTESPRSAMLAVAQVVLAPGAWVLDVGAGSGRDVAALRELGLQAFGVEPHAGMRAAAERLHPGLAGGLRDAALPALGQPFLDLRPEGFDAVVCSAVLMHIPPAELPLALAALVAQLRQPAAAAAAPALLISLPDMAPQQLRQDRDADGRRFHNHAPAIVQALLAGLGLSHERTQVSDAVLASTGTRWHTLVFRRG